MDLSNLFQSLNVDDRRTPQQDRPSFNYANPFSGIPDNRNWIARGAEAPWGLAAQAGAGDMSALIQHLLTQSALERLAQRGQLPSHDWTARHER